MGWAPGWERAQGVKSMVTNVNILQKRKQVKVQVQRGDGYGRSRTEETYGCGKTVMHQLGNVDHFCMSKCCTNEISENSNIGTLSC